MPSPRRDAPQKLFNASTLRLLPHENDLVYQFHKERKLHKQRILNGDLLVFGINQNDSKEQITTLDLPNTNEVGHELTEKLNSRTLIQTPLTPHSIHNNAIDTPYNVSNALITTPISVNPPQLSSPFDKKDDDLILFTSAQQKNNFLKLRKFYLHPTTKQRLLNKSNFGINRISSVPFFGYGSSDAHVSSARKDRIVAGQRIIKTDEEDQIEEVEPTIVKKELEDLFISREFVRYCFSKGMRVPNYLQNVDLKSTKDEIEINPLHYVSGNSNAEWKKKLNYSSSRQSLLIPNQFLSNSQVESQSNSTSNSAAISRRHSRNSSSSTNYNISLLNSSNQLINEQQLSSLHLLSIQSAINKRSSIQQQPQQNNRLSAISNSPSLNEIRSGPSTNNRKSLLNESEQEPKFTIAISFE